MGFGSSVIQRLCKTSVKKNIYWEIKDRVIEEAFNGTRMAPQARKVKVYGLDSTKSVRARLIEILMQRVMYHKDKFISPIIYDEMRSMEVKKSGKVEHSDKTHDDQVFSYLMALYVWYEGKNLVENFGIRKTTILTDSNDEFEVDQFEDAIEKKERLDFEILNDDVENPDSISHAIEWVSNTKSISQDQLQDAYQLEVLNSRNNLMFKDSNMREQMYQKTSQGVILDPVSTNVSSAQFIIPSSIFNLDDDDPLEGQEEYTTKDGTPVKGNMASMFISL